MIFFYYINVYYTGANLFKTTMNGNVRWEEKGLPPW